MTTDQRIESNSKLITKLVEAQAVTTNNIQHLTKDVDKLSGILTSTVDNNPTVVKLITKVEALEKRNGFMNKLFLGVLGSVIIVGLGNIYGVKL